MGADRLFDADHLSDDRACVYGRWHISLFEENRVRFRSGEFSHKARDLYAFRT